MSAPRRDNGSNGRRTARTQESFRSSFLLSAPRRDKEQRNGTTPGSWQSSSVSASRCHVLERTQENGTDCQDPGVLTLLLQLPVVTSWSGHRSNGTEPLLGPGSPHSPPSASRCHVLERTQEQRNGTTPGSWQSSLSSFSFPLSRLGADTGATERNHSWVLAVLTLLLQLPVTTSWSGHRSRRNHSRTQAVLPFRCSCVTSPRRDNGKLKEESEDSRTQESSLPPSASRCHVLERTQEQRNGTTPGSWQSSFSFPLSVLDVTHGSNGTEPLPGSWQSSFSFPLSCLDNGKLSCQDPGVIPFRCSCVRSKT